METTEKIKQIVHELGLLPHPEGGFYKEMYRSAETTLEGSRNLMTSIYFLLTSENCSRFHRIQSDEHWYFHAGSPLVVHMLNEKGYHAQSIGNDFNEGLLPYFMVPKHTIFGSTVLEKESFSLVSCAVAPGFDFQDFELFEREALLKMYPDYPEIITQLT
jgi:predicted cupin superfamily sugar epimerase